MQQWKKEIKESGSRINVAVLNFLTTVLIHNMVELAEVDIFFDVFSDLIDPTSEKVYLTESAFCRLFYEVLLRFNFECSSESFYICLEKSVLFFNKHLGNIEMTPFGGFKICENKKVLGSEAIVQVHLYSAKPSVKELSQKFLYQLFIAELDQGQGVDKVVLEDFIQPCQEVMATGHENLASDPNSIQVILSGVDLISRVLKHILGDKSGNSPQQNMQARNVSSRANGTLIKLVVENNTAVQKHKTMDISISIFDTVRSLKSQILEVFGTFAAHDLFLMCKGRMIYELDKSLKENGISEGQKILLFVNELEEPAEDFMMKGKTKKIADVKEILPEVNEDVISYALTQHGDDVQMAVSVLSDGGSFFIGEELSDIEKKKRELTQSAHQGGINEGDLRNLLHKLAQSEGLYDLIFKLMKLEHSTLKAHLWNLLKLLPIFNSAKQVIEQQTKGQDGDNFEFAAPGLLDHTKKNWRINIDEIVSSPSCDSTCYQLYVLANVIKESSDDFLHEWLLMEGTLASFGMILQGRDYLPPKGTRMDIEVPPGDTRQNNPTFSPVDEFCVNYSRFFCNLGGLIKELNAKYLSPPSLKISIPKSEHIMVVLLRELDLNKEFDPTTGIPHEFYGEMFTQILEENQFINQLEKLTLKLLESYQEVQFIFVDLYLDAVLSVVPALLDYYSATKNIDKLNLFIRKLIPNAVQTADQLNIPMATVFMNLAAYYICLNNLEVSALTWLNGVFVSQQDGQSTGEYRMALNVASALVEILERKTSKVPGISQQAETLLVDLVLSFGKKFKMIVDDIFIHPPFSTELVVNFLNDLTAVLRLVIRLLKSINSEFHELEVLKVFRVEVIEYVIFSIMTEPESSFTQVVVDQNSKIRLHLFEMVCYYYDRDWKLSLNFLNQVRILYQDTDFKSSSLSYVDYRRNGSYIGIRNLGSTCYANSLFQQFFHNRRIRDFIHQLPIDVSAQQDSMSGNGVLKEIMLLFGQLALNKSSQADLTGFTCKFTGFDGMPINVKVQQDVNEFFNLLLDCLERELDALRLPNNEDAFKSELGGAFLNEITSGDPNYDYFTSNEEHFNTITIDVKNVHSMQNGLEKFFQPTIFDGDNKLHVDKYQTKIVAKKSTWLSKDLPKTLVVMLKRFEYDMRNYTRYKLNDFFEFPLDLNLQKHVKSGTLSESIEVLGDGALYSYKLKGVLVHSGSSEFGHYYSYICVNGKWMEFNDTKVADFDPTPENIRREWFGGESEDAKNFVSAGRQSSKSAYILFYERVHQDGMAIEGPAAEPQNNPLDVQLVSPAVKAIIEEQNKAFIRKKVFSDGITLRFLNEMLDRLDKDEAIEALADQLIKKEGEEETIKDAELYAFLQHTRSIVLNKLGSRYEILKPLANASNEMHSQVQAVFVDEYIPNQDVLNKVIYDSGPNSRRGGAVNAGGMFFESFGSSKKAQKSHGNALDSPNGLASPTAEGILVPEGEVLSEEAMNLIQESLDLDEARRQEQTKAKLDEQTDDEQI